VPLGDAGDEDWAGGIGIVFESRESVTRNIIIRRRAAGGHTLASVPVAAALSCRWMGDRRQKKEGKGG